MKLLQCCCSADSKGLSLSHRWSLAFCRGFCSTICLQLLAIVQSSISPCSVDIGNSLEGIVTEFELMQRK